MAKYKSERAQEEALVRDIEKYGYEVECLACGWAGKRNELLVGVFVNTATCEILTKKVCPSCGTWIWADNVSALAFLKARRQHKKLPNCDY